ncbi:M81 family metallopeptidase [Bordetella sp. 2513F-2]
MRRIAIGGFQHETNTFSSQSATLADFLDGSGWPGLLEGANLLQTTAAMNLPVAGAAAELKGLGYELVPLVWAAATPSGRVEDSAFDAICERFLRALESAGPLDGVYLDLHGAMATTTFDDAEGEFLRRLRARLGPELPIVASLDLHANVSAAMVTLADGLVGYRTYPHIDMVQTGARAARLLHARLVRGVPLAVAWRPLDFLVPLSSQCTLAEPAAGLYAKLEALERELGLASLSWTGGFPLADVPDCGQAVLAYGETSSQVEAAVQRYSQCVAEQETAFQQRIWDDAEAVAHVMPRAAAGHGPIVLADTQDNPGGGGASDTTGLLRALVAAGAQNAVVAMIRDGEAVRRAYAAGASASVHLALGGRTPDATGHPGVPCTGLYEVERLTDGRFTGTGPMWGGSPIDLGPTALLRLGGVRVIVTTGKMQAADQSILRHVGIEPAEVGILALKSSVHFRADFQALAKEILVVASPGLVRARLRGLPYHKLRPGLRMPA